LHAQLPQPRKGAESDDEEGSYQAPEILTHYSKPHVGWDG